MEKEKPLYRICEQDVSSVLTQEEFINRVLCSSRYKDYDLFQVVDRRGLSLRSDLYADFYLVLKLK